MFGFSVRRKLFPETNLWPFTLSVVVVENCPKNESSQFSGECWYCGEKGHKAHGCAKLKKDMIAKRNVEKAKLAIGIDGDYEYISDFDDLFIEELGM